MANETEKGEGFRKILSNASIIVSGNFLGDLLQLASVAIMTRTLGAAEYGVFVLMQASLDIIVKIFNFQTWRGFIKFSVSAIRTGAKAEFVSLLKFCFVVDALSVILGGVVAFTISSVFFSFYSISLDYASVLYLLIVSLVFNTLEVTTGLFRVYDEFRIQAKIQVFSSLVKLIGFFIIMFSTRTLLSFALASMLQYVLGFILRFQFSKQLLKKQGITIGDILGAKIDFNGLRKRGVVSFVWFNNLDVTIRMISRQMDVVIIGKLLTTEVVAIYRIAVRVVSIVGRLTDPLYQTIYPEFAKLLDMKRYETAKRTAFKIIGLSTSLGLAFYLAFIVFGKFAIVKIFGTDYAPSYGVARIYYLAILISLITLPIIPWLHSLGLAKVTFRNQLISTFCYLSALYPLIHFAGVNGAAFAYVFYYLVWSIVSIMTIVKRGENMHA